MADIKYTMPPPTEDVEQMCLFRWADAQSGKYPELSLMYHIPNGGKRGKAEAARFRAMGVKSGVPDIFLPVGVQKIDSVDRGQYTIIRTKYNGLYIELKRLRGGTVSAAQKQWIARLRDTGYVCVTTIYSYISKGVFASLTDSDLPDKPKRHRKAKENKKGSRPPRGESIEKRPEAIDNREEFGHWEMDTVYSAAETSLRALLVLTERKTRKEIIIVMPDRTAKSTVLALNRLERRFGAKFRKIFKSITVDNGTEFSDLEGMKKSILYSGLRTKFYYCHPYSSWERGSNENLNRMIRRKFPKGTSFADVTRKQVQNVEDWMNNYPRKVLGYLTAEMAYQACVAAL